MRGIFRFLVSSLVCTRDKPRNDKLSHYQKKTISGFALCTGLDEFPQHPEFLGPHAALAPDEANLAIAAALHGPGLDPGVLQDRRTDRHLRDETQTEIS